MKKIKPKHGVCQHCNNSDPTAFLCMISSNPDIYKYICDVCYSEYYALRVKPACGEQDWRRLCSDVAGYADERAVARGTMGDTRGEYEKDNG